MSKKEHSRKSAKGTGFATGLLLGVVFAFATGNNGLFVIGIAIGAALESTYIK